MTDFMSGKVPVVGAGLRPSLLNRELNKTLRIMKLAALLLFAAVMQVSAKGVAQEKITLAMTNVSLDKVFDQIEAQTGFVFIYKNETVKNKKVSINVSNASLAQTLDVCLKGQALSYQIVGKSVAIKTEKGGAAAPGVGEAPPYIDVRGRVVNEKGDPVEGVTVTVKGSNTKTLTDKNGEFSLATIDKDATLVFTHVSMESFELKVSGRTEIAISLKARIRELSDVVVSVNTGYQEIPKERATGSFVKVDNTLLNRSVSTNILNRLEGVTSGLLFNRNVNAVNNPSGLDISIRGTSTLLSNNQPLIIVDNFPYDGNIANINPNDVENITILKDAAAASIWGAFSGNGVIVITTKKGKLNQKLSVDFNSNVTVGKKPDLFYNPNWLNSNDFIDLEIDLFKKGYYNNDLISAGKSPVSPVVLLLDKLKRNQIDSISAYNQINTYRGYDVRNDLDKYLLRTSVAQQYSVGIRGGSANSDYSLSVGYDKNLANYVGNENNRITVNSQSNFYLTKKLQLTAGFNYIQATTTTNNNMSNIQVGGAKTNIYPYARLADENGIPLAIVKDFNNGYKDTVGKGKVANWDFIPLEDRKLTDFKNKLFDNRFNIGLKYSIIKDLSLDVKYQYERSNSNTTNYYNDSSYYVRNLYNKFTNLSTGAHPVPLGGILYSSNNILTSNRARAQLNYSLNKSSTHYVASILGAEISQAVNEGNANTAYGYNQGTKSTQVVDLLNFYATNPTGSIKIPNSFGFSRLTDRYISYFGNGAYTYAGKYTFSLSGRIDKSNLFGVNTNQKSVPLYSAGVRWNLSNENFYKLSWLPYSNIRITYGYNGNVNKKVTAVTTIRELSNSTYYGLPFDIIANSGNPELRWEKVRMINFGYDFSAKNQVISGTLEYYIKRGIDLIGDSPLPPSVGLSTFTGNTANTKGKGFDVTLNSNNINNKNFKWQTTLLVSYVKDIVSRYNVKTTASNYVRYGDNNGGSGTTIYPLEGKPLYAIYSYKWGGLDPNTGDPLGYIGKNQSSDYNTIIANATPDSMLFNGTSRPTTFGSLRNSFSYKGFMLSFNIVFKLNYYFRRTSVDYDGMFSSWKVNKDYVNRWQHPGDEAHTNVPSITYPPVNTNRDLFYQYSSVLVEKGDHIRFQDISLSYDFEKVAKKVISRLQVYTYVNNVGILWRANKSNLDPDVYTTSLPAPTTFSFGVKASF